MNTWGKSRHKLSACRFESFMKENNKMESSKGWLFVVYLLKNVMPIKVGTNSVTYTLIVSNNNKKRKVFSQMDHKSIQ